jgi:hypothetical protein
MSNHSKTEIYMLICFVSSLLETWELALLGWPNGDKERFLSIWFTRYYGWLRN